MSLYSFSFILYFSIALVVMGFLQLLKKKWSGLKNIQLVFLLIISYFILARTDWRFCICIAATTAITYIIGILSEKSNKRKIITSLGIVVLILFLGYFKYANFFLNSFRYLFHLDTVTLNIVLPLGISFYIFSEISYLIDVYRGSYPAERNLLLFALFISFFPKLTAGPIVRGDDFFSQARAYRGLSLESFKVGIQIFVFGLFKKIVLANHLGVFVDDVFNSPVAFNTGTVIWAVISYSLQIYFDFSGYSDMAIGVSKILGFDFKPNFNLPYISQSISEFWKRWHISLSSWFQEYIYIPLGGSRKGALRTSINLLTVMLISGIWHGAGWTFIVWGVLHGIVSCVNKALCKKLKRLGPCFNVLITFILVTLFWVVFRAESLSTAIKVWTAIFTLQSGISQPYTWSFFAVICLLVGIIATWYHSKKTGNKDRNGNLILDGFYPILNLSKFWAQVAFFTFCGLTIILGYFGNTAFIYGAF